MKYEKSSNTHTDLMIDSFGGLDRSGALCGGKGSFELRNLRLMADGSLARRPGLSPLVTLPSNVRGAVSVLRGGAEDWYAVAGDTVYYLAPDGQERRPEAIGSLTTQTGSVDFLCHDGTLLMLDGEELYTLTPTAAKPTEAYVPLYGREWQTVSTTNHVMYEQPNLLSRRLRLQFRMSADGKILPLLALVPESLDAIVIDGVLYRGNYSYSQQGKMISVGDEQKEGSLVEVYLTMPDEGNRARITRAGRMAAIDRAEEARVLFYDIPNEAGVFISREPMDTDLGTVRTVLPDACGLYVTEGDRTVIGDGVHRVTGAVRHYDRSLVFTARDTWMTRGEQNEDGTLRFIPVNTMLGCQVAGGAAVLGNRPMTVHGGHLLAWSSDTDERDECNASPISTPVDALIREIKGDVQIFADSAGGEVWLYSPGQGGRILVYQSEQETFTSYDGFVPQCLAMLGDKVGVGQGKTLYLLDGAATADTLVDDEHPEGVRVGIEAEYRSAFFDFGSAESVKRLCRGTVVAACGHGRMTLLLQNVSGRSVRLALRGDGGEVSALQGRAPMGRFRFLRVGLLSEDDAPLRLYSIRLSARRP